MTSATIKAPKVSPKKKDNLKSDKSPALEIKLPKVISLFAGAGGLDLGFKDEGFEIVAAFDISESAIRSHKRNFPTTEAIVADLVALQPSGVLTKIADLVARGERIGIIGGPPCQGFSRANASSRADDPRNEMPNLYLQIIKELQKKYAVEFIVLENVLGIRDKKHAQIYKALITGLGDLNFSVSENELCAVDFGVPQNRRRVIVSGLNRSGGYSEIVITKALGLRTVKEAIGELGEPAFFRKGLSIEEIPCHPNHWTMMPKSPRFKNPTAYSAPARSFRKLKWDKPSPTIAFGNREIHVHPSGKRRLSIYEAMLLQGFPTTFVLEGNLSQQVQQISNAVPPPLARCIATAVRHSLTVKEI